jgi:hypothetical protein
VAVFWWGARLGLRAYKHHLMFEWKKQAIPEIDAFCLDTNGPAAEFARIRGSIQKNEQHAEQFYSHRLIPFQNGEWVAYANKSGNLDWRFHDFVIAQGSDGVWYYTTMHFCPDMIELFMNGQPKSLKGFKKRYYFREFSGNPEDELTPTAPNMFTWSSSDDE